MTNITENNVEAFSSPTPSKVSEGSFVFDNLTSMKLEISKITQGVMSYVLGKKMIENSGLAKIRTANELDGDNISPDEKEDTSLFNPVDPSEVYLLIIKCPTCDFDIEVSSRRGHYEDYDAYNMICPVCDEKFGEDMIGTLQNSSFPILHKNHSVLNGNSEVHHDNEDASWSNGFLSDDFLSGEGDTVEKSSNDSSVEDISIVKSEGEGSSDTDDEQKVQEKSNKAAFVQDLLMSSIFLE